MGKQIVPRSGSTKLPKHLIQGPKPLAESIVCQAMADYYTTLGDKAWAEQATPSLITSCVFIARAYARLICAYALDEQRRAQQEDRDFEPVLVIEAGAGHGRFGHYCMAALEEGLPRYGLAVEAVRYIMTDYSEKNVSAWQQHPRIKPRLAQGRLDLARFDFVTDTSLQLRTSGEELGIAPTRAPMLVICNYLFDTLPPDGFQVQDGSLSETLVSTYSGGEQAPDLADPLALEALDFHFSQRPISLPHYDDTELDALLHSYALQLDQGSFLLPASTLLGIRRLRRWTSGSFVVLAADRGNWEIEEMRGLDVPEPSKHSSLSWPVNFHALRSYCLAQQGFCLSPSDRAEDLEVVLFGFGPKARFPTLEQSYRETIDEFGPHDYFMLHEQREPHSLQLTELCSLLKLGGWDPSLVFQAIEALLNGLEQAPESLRTQLSEGLMRARDSYFYLERDQDLPFELGRCFSELGLHQEAIRCYENSLELFEPSAATALNLGLCHWELGNRHDALRCFEQSLRLEPDYPRALEWQSHALNALTQDESGFSRPAIALQAVDADNGGG